MSIMINRMRLIAFVGAVLLLFGCGGTPDPPAPSEARKELIALGISISDASFAERVEEGDVVAVQLFLAAGMSANKNGDETGMPLLMQAAYRGHSEIVRKLLDAGANLR